MHWLIQKNIIKNQEPYIEALKELNIPFTLINTKKNFIKKLNTKEKYWAFGSVGLVLKLYQSDYFSHSVDYDPIKFQFNTMLKQYQDKVLNNDAKILPFKDITIEKEPLFIKPNRGLKIFNGKLMYPNYFKELKKRVINNKMNFNENELMVVSSKKFINKEYRLFIVNNEIITACQTMEYSYLNLNEFVPEEVFKFAKDLINIWIPSNNFVLDVAKTPKGLKVVEINCINSSGPYLCDMKKVISALSLQYQGRDR